MNTDRDEQVQPAAEDERSLLTIPWPVRRERLQRRQVEQTTTTADAPDEG